MQSANRLAVSNKSGRAPSMADVAAAAGVSHQTVSRVLNSKGAVREETRQRVLDAIAEMGYRRNEAARTLASSESRLLGVVTPRFVEWGPATILLSVQLAANRAGYFVSVGTIPEFTSTAIRSTFDDLFSLGVAGLIVISPLEAMARELDALTLPVPTLAIASRWTSKESSMPRIGVDQRAGVKSALQHLLAKGCRSVAHIAGPDSDFDAMERDEAWKQYTGELGLERGARLQGGWTAEDGYQAGKQLARQELPDAVFVANDQMSLGVLKALRESGVKVPDDILLVGYDDQDGVAFFEPSLTTIRQDFEGIGEQAIGALTALMKGRPPELRMLPSELVVRETA